MHANKSTHLLHTYTHVCILTHTHLALSLSRSCNLSLARSLALSPCHFLPTSPHLINYLSIAPFFCSLSFTLSLPRALSLYLMRILSFSLTASRWIPAAVCFSYISKSSGDVHELASLAMCPKYAASLHKSGSPTFWVSDLEIP